MKFPVVYLLHGMGGSPNGSVSVLEAEFRKYEPEHDYIRPLLPHSDPNVLPSASVDFLRGLALPKNALLIGISLGGLVAAKLQEAERPELHVICISSPTYAGDVELEQHMDRRVSLYSSKDSVIQGRTKRWPKLGLAYDLEWMSHDTDMHAPRLATILKGYVGGHGMPMMLPVTFDVDPEGK
jgi:pimeloyl-ACP methyl ester carboxylesterase